jgi:glycosyltransferase involved in cell wall biosynthesis
MTGTPLKIALLSPHYPPRYIGGVEAYTRRIGRRLRAAGQDVVIAAVERIDANQPDPVQVEATDDEGLRVWRLSIRAFDARARFVATYAHPDVEIWLRDWLARERPAVVHLQSGYLFGGALLRAAATCAIPVVVTLHDFWFVCPRITLLRPTQECCAGPETAATCGWCLATEQRRYRLPAQWLGTRRAGRLGAQLADSPIAGVLGLRTRVRDVEARQHLLVPALAGAATLLSPSRFLRDQMVQAGVDRHAITLLPYGIEPRPPLPRRTPDGVRLRLGFLGQIAPHKGVHVLIQAVRALADPAIELIIHGDPTREPAYMHTLQALAADDRRVIFAGPLPQTALDELFQRIDLLAVPSVWYENSPFVIHEARRAGLPVLASRLGGMAELIHHEVDGLLAEAGSAASFAQQIDRLTGDPELLVRLRGGVAPPPTLDAEVSALIDIYHRVAAPHALAAGLA